MTPTPTALLWDLDLGNVEATPYVKLGTASPSPPPPLEDVCRYPPLPGTSSQAHTLLGAHISETSINYNLQQSYVDIPS
ncbi:uncharacterized protein C8R40DRAFT_1171077 [Lentinula edodes]|uniref:uncharacterized protein n=1 Tax=Lentinula edodes TaxID=5353 RepID=UPI001E8DA0BF|nr:uncharacterized protein C8R40DRAFT_1171077 [Lentinula edodes]KAH7874978.1 hypothetical protein C8R40DRAFT_1171077 [Lentinula edodes]